MTDDTRPETSMRLPGQDADAPLDPVQPEHPDEISDEGDVPTNDNPLLREGSDAPDAADIEDPETQR